MNRGRLVICLVVVCVMAVANTASADTFGSGANQFTMDFVPISGSVNPTSGIPAGEDFTFTGVANSYRMGTYEVSNGQWNKFKAAYGVVTGRESNPYAYTLDPYWTGENIATNCVSWYEAAQFVNYLNTSTGHQSAYKFTGTQGTSNYTFTPWAVTDAGYNADNPIRDGNAFYFLPTENEWVKAAYWDGTSLQAYANASAGDLVSGLPDRAKWNYSSELWNVTSGIKELNDTYNMMGNAWEWMESPYYSSVDYTFSFGQCFRGGSFGNSGPHGDYLASSTRYGDEAGYNGSVIGFRVASVPEPCSLALLALGGVALLKRRWG